MDPFLCAIASQEAQEDLIGTASPCDTFVFIECPQPWSAKAFESARVPETLRCFVRLRAGCRFFLIDSPTSGDRGGQILIYQRQTGPFCGGYDGYELQVDSLEQAAIALQAYFQGDRCGQSLTAQNIHDVFVCVHGSRDKCCARFGRPFFNQAAQQLRSNPPSVSVRLWQVSHIGGHRFAPTAIHLPDGRCYGRLNAAAFQALLQRIGLRPGEGDASLVTSLLPTYRGWSVLPEALQALERHLMAASSAEWFFNQVAYTIQGMYQDPVNQTTLTRARLLVLAPGAAKSAYSARILKQPAQQLRLSCEAADLGYSYRYRVRCRRLAVDVASDAVWAS